MALPAAADFIGSSITEAQFKAAITNLRDYIATMETVAPGVVAFYPKTTAPTGWLKANGAAISRTTYAALFAAIGVAFGAGDGSTTFNVPDLRGEFIRGLDDGRGVDTGRTLSSTVQSADAVIPAHTHSITANSGNTPDTGVYRLAYNRYGPTTTVSITGASVGTETRPRNIALLACIKY
jgi:microcystin-dependent protein